MRITTTTPFILSAVLASVAYAGDMGAVIQETPSQYVYIEGNVGYAFHPWKNDRATTVGLENQLGVLTNLSNINGGAVGGADIGFQFNRYLGIEGGWSYIPRASYNRTSTVTLPVANTTFTLPQGLQVNINSGLAYIGLKGTVPLFGKLDGFAKIAGAYSYNHTNVDVPASLVNTPVVHTTHHSNYLNPLFGFGLQYPILENFRINVQYDYVPGYEAASANNFITPPIQLATFGLGYQFPV